MDRNSHVESVLRLLRAFPVVAIVGARQVGKTTLARMVERGFTPVVHYDLEDDRDLARLEDPMLELAPLRGLVVLDEIQHRPELFRALRVLSDRPRRPARFLVLGSAAPELLRQSSETLAGRISYHELGGFGLDEIGTKSQQIARLWLRGGFPRSFLAKSEAASIQWREQLMRTYLERDLRGLAVDLPVPAARRFWSMLAHYHGQTWNGSELGRALALSHTTVRRWLDALTQTFMVRQLQPWFANLGKRQVRSPKVYIEDPGLLHVLLGIHSHDDLLRHPKVGASWEGFALRQVVEQLGAQPSECFFWATHQGAELDLLIVHGKQRLGFEFKRTSSPSITPSMRNAQRDLELTRLDVIHAGPQTFKLQESMRAVPLDRVIEDIEPLRSSRLR